ANAGVVTAKLATLAEIARTTPRETENLFIVTSFPSGISAVVKLIDSFRAARAAPKPKRLLENGSKRQGIYVRGCRLSMVDISRCDGRSGSVCGARNEKPARKLGRARCARRLEGLRYLWPGPPPSSGVRNSPWSETRPILLVLLSVYQSAPSGPVTMDCGQPAGSDARSV